MRFCRLLLACLALSAATPANLLAQVGPFPEPPKVTRLDNGLSVVTLAWPSPGIVAYFTLVRVGARDEVEKGHSGFAHLFEHMMFRGTQRFPKAVYERRIQELGADNNAYTTQDFTLYTLTGPAAALPEMVELEADRFQHLSYDEQTFRTETGAVLGEYNKSASSPFLKMWEALSELAFTRHTYGHTTIGYLADVLAMPDKFAYSQAFFRRFYTPDNTWIVVAGDLQHGDVVKLVEAHYAGWRGRRDQPAIPADREPVEGAQKHLDWDGIASPQLLIGYRGPAFEASAPEARGAARELGAESAARRAALRETAALEVVHGLLFDRSSPLYQELVVEQQRLLDLSSWTENFSRDPGLFVVHAELSPRARFDEIQERVQAALDVLARGADAERVRAVRSHLAYGFTMNVETASDAADSFAQFLGVSGREQALADYLAALAQVSAEDVATVAGRYLGRGRRFSVSLAPRTGEQKKAGAP
jgi:zinc protease